MKIVVFLTVVSSTMNVLGLAYWKFELSSDFILTYFFEGYCIWLLKDFFSLGLLHKLLHTPKYYYLHKLHHKWTKDTSNLYTNYYFDLLDIVLENAAGLFFYIPLKYLVTGSFRFNLYSYLLVVWIDHTLHSCNPYSSCFLNPLLDFVFRANIRHSLHHTVINDYFLFMPWSHIFPSTKRAEIENYNKLHKTDVD